jgi:type II secretory pathway pseudopilin PulG
MDSDLNAIIAILFIFIISLGVIFSFNIIIRYMGRIGRFEMLLIIVIMGFSLGYVVSLISYQQSLPDMRDLKRQTDIELIANALEAYLDSNDYDLKVIEKIPKCPNAEYIGTDPGKVNITDILKNEYLTEMPLDPFAKTLGNTYYTICISNSFRLELQAPKSETKDVISVIK